MTIDNHHNHTATVANETIQEGDRVTWNTNKTQLHGNIVLVRPDFYIAETECGPRYAVRRRNLTKEGP